MIESYDDYRFYLEADRLALDRKSHKPSFFGDDVWKFERLLRKMEYYHNCKTSIWLFPYVQIVKYLFYRKSLLLGYTIPLNVFGPGLSIAHRGTIVVSRWARIGENCRIHACVNIRTAAGYADKAPWTGDSVYIGPGAKIFGDIRIGDGVAIGVNAVVNASFGGPGISIAAFLRKKSTIMDRKGCWSMLRAWWGNVNKMCRPFFLIDSGWQSMIPDGDQK